MEIITNKKHKQQKKRRRFRIVFDLEAEGETWEEAQQIIEESLKGKIKNFTIKRIYDIRSEKQNNALHLWFRQMAEECNNRGLNLQKLLRIEVMWTGLLFKELIWKPVQLQITDKKSTKKLTTEEVNKIFEPIKKTIEERSNGDISVPFPSTQSVD